MLRRSTSDAGLVSVSGSLTQYSPGVNVAYNLATRVTATDTNLAADGTAATADTSGTAVPAPTANLRFGRIPSSIEAYTGTIALFRQWDEDLGDSGIEEASS